MKLSSVSVFISESIRLTLSNLGPKKHKQYGGPALEVCRKVVKDCWNGKFFAASSGYPFNDTFWIRDFSWNIDGLLSLGYKNEVEKTLRWALGVYKRSNAVTTTIYTKEKAVDVFTFSTDSLPKLLFCLKKAELLNLAHEYQDFLNSEILKYQKIVLNPKTNLVKFDRYFCTPKDAVNRKATASSDVFLIFLKNLLDKIPFLINPFKNLDLLTPFIETFWNGRFFVNDKENGGDFVSADSNIWPYWTGVIIDRQMLKNSIDAIKSENLDDPFPLKYHSFDNEGWMNLPARIFIPNYEGNSIWAMLASTYIKLESEFYPLDAKEHFKKYLKLIEKYKTYVEVFSPDGSGPLKGRFGHEAGRGMLWAANFLELASKF